MLSVEGVMSQCDVTAQCILGVPLLPVNRLPLLPVTGHPMTALSNVLIFDLDLGFVDMSP